MIFAAFCILDQMSTDLLARVRKLTTGTVEIDGGKLPGSDVSTGQVIRCAVVCGIIPMTHCSFSKRGKLGVQVESPWGMVSSVRDDSEGATDRVLDH